jgi:hypothetical protein
MRNIFDQYEQPENRLTHALACCFAEDTKLLKQFVKWLTEQRQRVLPKKLEILEQQVPGGREQFAEDEAEKRGIPDIWIHDGAKWCLLIESKVNAILDNDQLDRHYKTAIRHGFEDVQVLAIDIAKPTRNLPPYALFKKWSDVYSWFSKLSFSSQWAWRMVKYMETAENRMSADGYLKEGTMTKFNGIPFVNGEPYSYLTAKRCLNSLIEELKNYSRLKAIYNLDPTGGRKQITGKTWSLVWDYIPFAGGTYSNFTNHPHLTFVIKPDWVQIQITLPNGAKASYWNLLVTGGKNSMAKMLQEIHHRLGKDKSRQGFVKLWVEVLQRHYRFQKDVGIKDGELYFDVDCLLSTGKLEKKVRTSLAWLDALDVILANRRKANTQIAIVARYDYVKGSIVGKPEFVDEAVRALEALKPFYEKIIGS